MPGPLLDAIHQIANQLEAVEKAIAAKNEEVAKLIEHRFNLTNELMTARMVLGSFDGENIKTLTPEPGTRPPRVRPIRDSSTVGYARRVLMAAKQPMHIDDIVRLIEQMTGLHVNKATVVSNLSRYVKAGDTFRRTAKNTFELIPESEPKKEIRLVG